LPKAGRVYRLGWLYFWFGMAAVGSGVAVTAFGWATTVTAALVSAALGCGAYCTSSRRVRARRHRQLIITVIVVALAGVALAGWLYCIGPAAAALPIAVVLTSPALFNRLDRRLPHRQQRGPSAGGGAAVLGTSPAEGSDQDDEPMKTSDAARAPAADLLPVEVGSLSDEALCQGWRTSFIALEQLLAAGDTAQQALLVSRRQQYLDELERRHPDGVAQWLLAGAGPASDPAPYILSPRHRSQ
jgi:hypothetical protein